MGMVEYRPNGGNAAGLQVSALLEGSPASRSGEIVVGDVVRSINRYVATDTTQLPELLPGNQLECILGIDCGVDHGDRVSARGGAEEPPHLCEGSGKVAGCRRPQPSGRRPPTMRPQRHLPPSVPHQPPMRVTSTPHLLPPPSHHATIHETSRARASIRTLGAPPHDHHEVLPPASRQPWQQSYGPTQQSRQAPAGGRERDLPHSAQRYLPHSAQAHTGPHPTTSARPAGQAGGSVECQRSQTVANVVAMMQASQGAQQPPTLHAARRWPPPDR